MISAETPTPERTPPPPPTPPFESSMSTLTSSEHHEVVVHLEEFQWRQQAFDADIANLMAQPASSISANTEAELRRLKERFTAWKRDYKARLRDAKFALHNIISDSCPKI
jgi:myosin V